MSETMRRSWLMVPMPKPELIARAAQSGADAIVLDLVELVAGEDKHAIGFKGAMCLRANQVEPLNRAFN